MSLFDDSIINEKDIKKPTDYYTNPIFMTQQFRFCGNPFRIDMYERL